MPNKKPKSKRTTLHQKFKVEKKVRQHHKKQRREAKRNPGLRKKIKKDPGVPNLHPLKSQILSQYAARKEKIAAEQEKDRLRKEREKLNRKKLTQSEKLQQMVDSANSRNEGHEIRKEMEENHEQLMSKFVDYKDNSRRAYFKEFKKLVDAADVILEVLDARDPLGCRCADIEQRILTESPEKKIIFVLNKIDLVPPDNVEAWLKYLRQFHPAIAFKCSTQQQKSKRKNSAVSTSHASQKQLKSAECLGADTLVQLLKNYSRNNDIKTMITVGIIGYPNVGKSSLINSLKREKAVGVGSTPGFTKTTQEIRLDSKVVLMDCPGIVFATGNSDEIALRNCVKVSQIVDPVSPIGLIMKRVPVQRLQSHFGLPEFSGQTDFLALLAQRRGKLRPGGVPDLEAAARAVLEEWCEGKLPYFTQPPQLSADSGAMNDAVVVTQFAPEFDINALLESERVNVLSHLPSNNDAILVESSAPAQSSFLQTVDDDEMDDDMANDNGVLSSSAGAAYLQRSAAVRGKGKNAVDQPKEKATDNLNLQTNQDRKRKQKAAQKARRKAQQQHRDATSAVDMDAPFDFASDMFGGEHDDNSADDDQMAGAYDESNIVDDDEYIDVEF